ncbi:hypothetical protein L3Q67_31775 [Saccharothrix sp. AJ9571]|nr:hypothetical protein L3Q67_31775 [Saccharothrix sp. AJ9571]
MTANRVEVNRDGRALGAPADAAIRAKLRDAGIGEQAAFVAAADLRVLLARVTELQRAKRRHRPEAADLPLLVVRAQDGHWPLAQFDRWRSSSPGAEVLHLPGDHRSVLDSNGARAIADRIAAFEPLGPQHNRADHAAWTSSIEHIRSTPGYPDGDWP